MPCSTPHDFCEMACNSCGGSLPAPTSSRSMTNLGMTFPPARACTMHGLREEVRTPELDVLRPGSRAGSELHGIFGTGVPDRGAGGRHACAGFGASAARQADPPTVIWITRGRHSLR